jgi:UPF0755 protein
MNKRIIAIILLLLIFSIWLQPFNFGKQEITLPEGANAHQIAEYLAAYHIVRDTHEFLLWLRILGKDRDLKSGTYELPMYKNPLYVIKQVSAGGKCDIMVTIPEGFDINEIAEVLDETGIIAKEKFVKLCNDTNFIHRLGLNLLSLEGYLFPDTYSFSRSQSDSSIIIAFLENFHHHINKFGIKNNDSLDTILTIASLVEKEAKYEDERPIIARVFINRLNLGRPLESCATVIYALKLQSPRHSGEIVITTKDLKMDSPYNTYLHTGLPPGPICSPGENSIKAVLSPADVKYLYFVLKPNGRHHFSQTYREHLAIKEQLNAAKRF